MVILVTQVEVAAGVQNLAEFMNLFISDVFHLLVLNQKTAFFFVFYAFFRG